MEYFRTDVKVGAFLLISLVLLLVAAVVVGDIGSWFVDRHHYTVLLPNANLLHRRAQVSYAGYPVGEVVRVATRSAADRAQQHPDYPIAVTIAVPASVRLHQNARVEMKTDGFIGDRYLDISPGSGGLVSDGDTLIGAIGGVEGMLASLSGIGEGLGEVSEALRTILTDASQPYSLAGLLIRMQHLLDTLEPRLTTLSSGVDDLLQGVKREVARTSTRAGSTLNRIDATIAENRGGVRQLMRELNASLTEARQTLASMRQFMDTRRTDVAGLIKSLRSASDSLQVQTQAMTVQIRQLLSRTDKLVAQNDRNIFVSIENLRDVMENLKAMSQLLRANPAVLLWGNRRANGRNPHGIVHNTNQILQDRGRIGRYDRTP